MPLEVIYVVRHGHRLNWTVDPISGAYQTSAPTKTGVAADVQLASYGTDQAAQLATKITTIDPPPDVLYSSPWYRCVQTIAPAVEALIAQEKTDGVLRIENGFGEFFGTAPFTHPSPSSVSELAKYFKFLDQSYKSQIRPSPHGETLEALHDRHAYALHRMIQMLDVAPSQPRAVLICTHAASMICIGRTLTGQVPNDITKEDFRCGTCALSRFDRRKRHSGGQGIGLWDETEPEAIPRLSWRNGEGVAGGWDCVLNGDCSFLEGGEERTWHFTGDESFINLGVEANKPDLSSRTLMGENGEHHKSKRNAMKL